MVFKSGVFVSAPTSPIDHAGILIQATEAIVKELDEISLLVVTNFTAISASSQDIVRFVVPE